MYETDALVIGAGVLGLACGEALARAGLETFVLDSARDIGTGISSRNSEVIHAGLYYPTDSLRHRLCVRGRRLLYDYLATRSLPHRKSGKLVVATDDGQTAQLDALLARGRANDVEGLQALTPQQATRLEPNLSCTAAILSGETGLVDSHAYMEALRAGLEDLGGALVLDAPVTAIAIQPDGRFRVSVGGRERYEVLTRHLVNSAGLHAHRLAGAMEGYAASLLPPFTLAKGSYFSCQAPQAFSHLIYPIPVAGGLGVHVTLDLAGQMRFGPDVEWLGHGDPDKVDYAVDLTRAADFYAAVRAYWPGLPDGAISPDYAGCRPKLHGPGETAADFRIDGPQHHGHAGLVHLLGIESPGLTSSLAIAEEVVRQVRG
ncbi:NAD(P)/FAD-dependent oxidoreductase [Hyphomonas johnsonii]|uniref:FAD dependent oxidoreductase n=1 Tax=Hyphomonas johnsonii MHS-2 TaxID=1280950 RepID=A0A059FUZ2_9PROT|nr:NAD(P)/FAD-dependent oxidoreductase [Hyphomonas johnsonii]KCZ94479.1 FAD dependent oxidoreductase [Hyphomonas johnsonii MHS-2]